MVEVRALAIGVILLAASACATAPRSEPQVGQPSAGLPILVENGSTTNIRVLARIGSSELLLGRVDGMQDRLLRLPLGVSGTMQLVARLTPSGGDAHFSEPFTLSAGHRITWKLRESPGAARGPRISTVHVFSCAEDERC
jgi:hypothetical protein